MLYLTKRNLINAFLTDLTDLQQNLEITIYFDSKLAPYLAMTSIPPTQRQKTHLHSKSFVCSLNPPFLFYPQTVRLNKHK